jgi:phosphoglucosamine mutase
MLRSGYNFGGEQSGHIVFFNYNTTGDGPLTALQVMYLMKKRNTPLSILSREITLYPQVLTNVKVKHKQEIGDIPQIMDAIRHAERKLAGKGRVLVRPSGTEPKIRVMLEGEDLQVIEKLAAHIAEVIQEKMI